MSDSKPYRFRPPLYHQREANGKRADGNGRADTSRHGDGNATREGWDAYRKWLSRVSGQPTRRSPLDASVYSWKGYHSWADKVRQNWKPES